LGQLRLEISDLLSWLLAYSAACSTVTLVTESEYMLAERIVSAFDRRSLLDQKHVSMPRSSRCLEFDILLALW